MTNTPSFKICPDCGAESAAQANHCWMCRYNITHVPLVVTAEVLAKSPSQASEAIFMVITLLLLGTALLIGIGLATEEAGLAILYAIFAVPPLVATAVSLQRRKLRQPLTWFDRFATLMISTAVMVGLAVLLVVAAVAALIGYCLVVLW